VPFRAETYASGAAKLSGNCEDKNPSGANCLKLSMPSFIRDLDARKWIGYFIYMGPHINSGKRKARTLGESFSQTRAIMDSFRRIVRALRHSSRQCEDLSGLTSAQFFVLQQIRENEGLSMNELAQLTFTHQSTVSEVVGRLVALGLVSKARSQKDSRTLVLSLTPRSRSKFKSEAKTVQENLVAAIQFLPPRKRASLAQILDELMIQAKLSEHSPHLFFEDSMKEKKRK